MSEIRPCPFCGSECEAADISVYRNGDALRIVCCNQCHYHSAAHCCNYAAIADHNALCALVEKGRLADEAVELLREWWRLWRTIDMEDEKGWLPFITDRLEPFAKLNELESPEAPDAK